MCRPLERRPSPIRGSGAIALGKCREGLHPSAVRKVLPQDIGSGKRALSVESHESVRGGGRGARLRLCKDGGADLALGMSVWDGSEIGSARWPKEGLVEGERYQHLAGSLGRALKPLG